MLGRFSEVLQNAADVLAPPATPLQDFMYHWKYVKTAYLNENNLPKTHISETNIQSHLNEMLEILVSEETEASVSRANGTLGPCLEYFLCNRLLDVLVELASSDSPPGARVFILSWFRKLLSCLDQSPLDHTSVFQPLKKLLLLCDGHKATPTETEEVTLLLSVCGLVRKYPNTAPLFIDFEETSEEEDNQKTPSKNRLFEFDVSPTLRRVSIVLQPDGHTAEAVEKSNSNPDDVPSKIDSSEEQKINNGCYMLLETLMTYLNSADSRIVLRACEGALVLSSLPSCNSWVLGNSATSLCKILTERMVDLFEALPATLDPTDVDDLSVSWGLTTTECSDDFPGSRQLTSLLCWLDYCDSICRESSVGAQLAAVLRKSFFETVIEPTLSEQHAVLATAVLSKCVKQISSDCLNNEISEWIVGPNRQPADPPHIQGTSSCSRPVWPLLDHLINNCQHVRNDLSLETLRLFEVLIEKPHDHILQCLLFAYVNNRGYYDNSSIANMSWSDEEDERDRRRGSAHGAPKSKTLAPANILKVVNSFLLLIPKQMLSDSGGVGYEDYMHDANRHYQLWIEKTEHFCWPVEAVWPDKEDSASCDSRPESDHHLHSPGPVIKVDEKTGSNNLDIISEHMGDSSNIDSGLISQQCSPIKDISSNVCHDNKLLEQFYEGPFLRMLFSKLKQLVSQPYELSLQVTAILSKLALLPHPYLHEILLGPGIPTAPGVNTLWTTLQTLSKQILSDIPRIEGFKEIIVETRHRLLGDSESESSENNPLFESLIVLEEFCKELAAIAFVKYHHATE